MTQAQQAGTKRGGGRRRSTKGKGKAAGSNGSGDVEQDAVAQQMRDAAARGDMKAVRAIGKTFTALEDKKAEIKRERKEWRERIEAAESRLKGKIEQDDDGTDVDARRKLEEVVLAYQELDEAQAGKKAALHPLMEERKELEARLRKQVHGAKQLGLFDD